MRFLDNFEAVLGSLFVISLDVFFHILSLVLDAASFPVSSLIKATSFSPSKHNGACNYRFYLKAFWSGYCGTIPVSMLLLQNIIKPDARDCGDGASLCF